MSRLVRAVIALVMLSACADDIDAVSPIDATVEITAIGCRNILGRGIGTVIAPGHVLTSAHTLAGANEISVTHGDSTTSGTLIAFDPLMDLAIVGIDDEPPTISAVALSSDPPHTDEARGLTGTIVVRRNERFTTLPVTIVRRVEITTEDIYGEGQTNRPGYELTADIEPGDSGALLVIDGEGIAAIWSRSRRTDGRAWAIDPIRGGATIRRQLTDGIGPDIDTSRC